MAKLKVFGINTHLLLGVQNRTIAAATSQKAFADLIDCSLGYVRDYGSETGNEQEVKLALSDVGAVFIQCKCCRSWVKYGATS